MPKIRNTCLTRRQDELLCISYNKYFTESDITGYSRADYSEYKLDNDKLYTALLEDWNKFLHECNENSIDFGNEVSTRIITAHNRMQKARHIHIFGTPYQDIMPPQYEDPIQKEWSRIISKYYDVMNNGCIMFAGHETTKQITYKNVRYHPKQLLYHIRHGFSYMTRDYQHTCDHEGCCNPEHLKIVEENITINVT